MPTIKVEISKLTKEKKTELIEKLTKTMSEITNIPSQSFTVYINEPVPFNSISYVNNIKVSNFIKL